MRGAFHEVKIEGDISNSHYAKVYIDGNCVRCRKYTVSQSVDEMPTATLELLGVGNYEHLAKVEIADLRNIAMAMDKVTFEEFCEIWKEVHDEM